MIHSHLWATCPVSAPLVSGDSQINLIEDHISGIMLVERGQADPDAAAHQLGLCHQFGRL